VIAPAIKQLLATVKSALASAKRRGSYGKALDRFSVRYNAECPNLNLDGRTPLKA
jgi:hypothetical protein